MTVILLRPRNSFRTQKRKRSPTVKVTRRERRANRLARERLVRELEPLLEEVFATFRLDATDQMQRSIVNAGNIGIPQASFEGFEANFAAAMSEAYAEGLAEGAQLGLRFGGEIAGVDVSTDLITEAAQSWIDQVGAQRVSGINANTGRALRQTFSEVLTQQISPQGAINRVSQQIGLDTNRARALRNFERMLVEQRIPTPLADTQFVRESIAQDVENRRQLLIRDRASTILETEMQEAVQNGERVFWNEAIKDEQVDPDVLLKRWLTVGDVRVCPICAPLNTQIAKFNDSFSSLTFTGLGPPAHPRCRCFMEFAPLGEFD